MATQPNVVDALTTTHLHENLKSRTVRGGFFTLGSQISMFVLQSIATVVLARLLTPTDFGLVAMVTAISSLAQSFSDLGLSEATIQCPEISRHQLSILFWVNVAIGLTLTLIMAALGPLLASFYRDPRLQKITFLMSLTFLIGGLRVQHDALLRRQMRFSSLALRDVASSAVAVPVSLLLAWRGSGYWALIALPLTMNLTQMLLSWSMVRWIPEFPRRGAKVLSLIGFGGNVAASYFFTNLIRNADNVLIGWYWGASPLGQYSRAYNLLMMPVRQLGVPASSVAIPAFSRMQDDPERLARSYLRTVNLMMWIAAPIFGFLFVAAVPVIVIVLGARWREAAPVFKILAIFSLGQMLVDSTVWLFVSGGQPRRLLRLSVIIAPIIVASYALGLPFGIKGVALSGSIVLLVTLPWRLKYSFYGTNLTLHRLWRALLCPISVCLFAIVVAELALFVTSPQRIISQLLIAALGVAVGYSLAVFIPSIRREVLSLKNALSERHSSAAKSVA